MTIPFWCVAVACLLPYLWLPLTWRARFALEEGFDNGRPRPQQARLTGLGARALGAHQNSLEALPIFASAVVVSHLASADPGLSQWICVAWVGVRVGHGLFYLFNAHPLRTLAWAVSYLLALSLFVLPLVRL